MYIKNFIKNNLLFIIILFFWSVLLANNELQNKKKSAHSIDLEIKQLELDLELQIKQQQQSEKKINDLQLEIKTEKKDYINNKNKQKIKKETLKRSNAILDSLISDLNNTINKKEQTNKIIKEIIFENEIISIQLSAIGDSINYINQNIEKNINSLNKIKTKIKTMLLELIVIKTPTEIEFLIESNSWDNFILQTILYDMLIENEQDGFNKLLNEQDKIKLQYNLDTLKKNKLILKNKNLNEEKLYYKTQLKNLGSIQKSTNNFIRLKEKHVTKIRQEYNNRNDKLTLQQDKINILSDDLQIIEKDKLALNKYHKKIAYEIKIKNETVEKIKKEIEKLIQTNKKIQGKPINTLKGKLPWPTDGKIVTKFGKNINPETNVIINYDLIEIQPIMTSQEQIQYLIKQINPKNPNKRIVKKFQNLTMNLNKGDVGYGVFGPKTTAMWKKYNKINWPISEQPVFVIHDGIIESITFINPIVGVVVIIRHDNNYFSVYSGNLDILVMKGSFINKGTKIGYINKQHILSFQLWNNKTPINPEKWLLNK